MRYVRLVACTDEYDSELGLILKGTPRTEDMMADRDGLLVAHDLIEHQNGPEHIGMVWDEMEALGGIWHARGRWGDLMRRHGSIYSFHENVASDLTRMFPEWGADGYPPRAHRLRATHPCDYDEDFQEIIAIARRDAWREHNDMGRGEPGEDEHGWTPALRQELDDYLDEALHRMRMGFRKACRRFGIGYESNSQMRAVKDAVHNATRQIDYEGQEFILGYGDGDATCRPVVEEFEW
jgi:hypothetical protein